MINEQIMKKATHGALVAALAIAALVAVPAVAAQMTSTTGPSKAAGQAKTTALIDNLDGISIGMTTDEVKDKLGKPEVSDAAGMLFNLDDDKTLQMKIDKDKIVTMIAVMYSTKSDHAPEAADIFGSGVVITPQENGNLYKRVRDTSDHYTVTYSRINLDKGHMTTITMQKAN